MKHVFLALLWLSSNIAIAQSSDHKAIRYIMAEQENAWNRGDLEGFMEGYWKSQPKIYWLQRLDPWVAKHAG